MIDSNTLNNAQAEPVRTSTTREKILSTIAASILGVVFAGVAIQFTTHPPIASKRPSQSEIEMRRALEADAAHRAEQDLYFALDAYDRTH